MATVTVYFLNTAASSPNWFGRVQDGGSAPAGALSAFGWTVGKTAVTTPYWRGYLGATARSSAALTNSYIDTAVRPAQGTGSGATTAGDSFRSDNPLNGTFAAGNWNFTFGMRTGAATTVGRIRLNVWASANADGTGTVRKLNSATLVGTTITMSLTTTTYNSTVTWAAPQVVLANEYLFTQIEWQETTAGTSNSCTAQFYQASFVTTDYVYAPATGTLSEIEDPDVAVSTGGKVEWLATLAAVEAADTAISTDGKVEWCASLAAIDAADVLAATGPVTKTFFNPAKTSTHLVLSSSNLTMTRAVDAVTWNPADIGSSGTLDGTNLVFTSGTDTGFTYTAVRATASASAGKFYSEHVVNVDVGRPLQVGLFNALRPLNSANGALSDGSLGAAIAYDSTGYIVTCAGAAASGLTTWTTGDRIGMAVDLDGSTIKWRKNGGSWTSDYSLSPLSVCAGTPTAFPAMVHARFVDTPAQTTTANFGPTFVDIPPSGYGAWGG